MRVNAGPVHGKTLATEGELNSIGPLSYLDVALIAVAFISGLLAMYRGFTREVLSILSWAVAGAAVLYVVLSQKQLAKEMADQIGTQLPVAQIVLGALVFLVVLIIVHLITAAHFRCDPGQPRRPHRPCSGSCSASSAASSSS